MDLFIVQVDGLDVAITDSEQAAVGHARQLAAEDPNFQVEVLRIPDGSTAVLPRIPAAEHESRGTRRPSPSSLRCGDPY